mgnify:CR=1 FL=1
MKIEHKIRKIHITKHESNWTIGQPGYVMPTQIEINGRLSEKADKIGFYTIKIPIETPNKTTRQDAIRTIRIHWTELLENDWFWMRFHHFYHELPGRGSECGCKQQDRNWSDV